LLLGGSLGYIGERRKHIRELPIPAGVEQAILCLGKSPIDVLGVYENLSGVVNLNLDKLIVNDYLTANAADKGDVEILVPIEILIDTTEIVESTFFKFHVRGK